MSKKRKPIYHLMKCIFCYVKLLAPIPIVFLAVVCLHWTFRDGLYVGNNEVDVLQVETGIVTNYRFERVYPFAKYESWKYGYIITLNGQEYHIENWHRLSKRFSDYYKDNEVTLYYKEVDRIFSNRKEVWGIYSADQQQCFHSLEQNAKDCKEFLMVTDILFLSLGLALVGYCFIYKCHLVYTFPAKQEWKKFKIRLKQEKAKKNKTK